MPYIIVRPKYLRVPEYVMAMGIQREACSCLYSETAYHVVHCLLPLFSPALLPAIGVDLRWPGCVASSSEVVLAPQSPFELLNFSAASPFLPIKSTTETINAPINPTLSQPSPGS